MRSLVSSLLLLAGMTTAIACGAFAGGADLGGLTLLPGEPDDGPLPSADLRERERLRFLVLGDSGTGKRPQWIVAEGMADRCETLGGCDFALLLGDAIYPSGVRPSTNTDAGPRHDRAFADKFERPYELFGRLDFWIVAGNHDWRRRGSVATQIAYSRHSPRWRMPALHYPVPKLPDWLRIYGLDTSRIESRGGGREQVAAARRTLCGPDGVPPEGGWRFLFSHHPVYSSGPHADGGGVLSPMRQSLLAPLIEACDVQLFFSGHDHHQEHLRAEGFDQVIQGAAARLRRPRRIQARRDGVRSLFGPRPQLGFAVVEVDPDAMTLRFFGCDAFRGCAETHCQAYDRSGFDRPAERSRSCPGG